MGKEGKRQDKRQERIEAFLDGNSGYGIGRQEWSTCWYGGSLADREKAAPHRSSKSTSMQPKGPREIISLSFFFHCK